MGWWELVGMLFEAKPNGIGWAVLGFGAAIWMRARVFRQVKAEKDAQLEEQQKVLDLQLQNFELLIKQLELRRLNGHALDGEG